MNNTVQAVPAGINSAEGTGRLAKLFQSRVGKVLIAGTVGITALAAMAVLGDVSAAQAIAHMGITNSTDQVALAGFGPSAPSVPTLSTVGESSSLLQLAADTSGGATGAENTGSGSMVAEGGTELAEAGETAALTGHEQAIEMTKAELPEHAQFVDGNGDFDQEAAMDYLIDEKGMSIDDAIDRSADMENEWLEAYNENSTEVQSGLA